MFASTNEEHKKWETKKLCPTVSVNYLDQCVCAYL